MIIDLHPEFGLELALGITYAYWLHERGELEGVRTVKGMKPFYYFCDNVEEVYDHRTIDNSAAGLDELPNNWIHHCPRIKSPNGVLDYSKEYKPKLIVDNKIIEIDDDGNFFTILDSFCIKIFLQIFMPPDP